MPAPLLIPAAIAAFGSTAAYGIYKGLMNEQDKNDGKSIKNDEPVGVMEGFEYGVKIPVPVFKAAITKVLGINVKK